MILQNLDTEDIIENILLLIGIVVGLIISIRVYLNNRKSWLNRFLSLCYLSVIIGLLLIVLTSGLFGEINQKGIQFLLLFAMLFFIISAICMIMCRNVLKMGEAIAIEWTNYRLFLISPVLVFGINLYFVLTSDFLPLESAPEYFTSIYIIPVISFYSLMLTYAIIGSTSFLAIMRVNMGDKRRNARYFFWGTLIAYVFCAPFFFIPFIPNAVGFLTILIGNLIISIGLFLKSTEK